jgi:IS5 family transposase
MHKKEIAGLIHKLKTGKADYHDKKVLEELWENAVNDTTILDKMPSNSREKLKNRIFHFIRTRLGLERRF